MNHSRYSAPEAFSLQPLLTFLPVKGSVRELKKMTASLYARYEKVSMLKKNLGSKGLTEGHQRILAEEAMLKQVLDWLALSNDVLP